MTALEWVGPEYVDGIRLAFVAGADAAAGQAAIPAHVSCLSDGNWIDGPGALAALAPGEPLPPASRLITRSAAVALTHSMADGGLPSLAVRRLEDAARARMRAGQEDTA